VASVRIGSGLLSTGQAAAILGASRQHVVDLCERGDLSFVWCGSHRRLRRSDVERLAGQALTREQEQSLWLHRAVAGRLVIEPERVLEKARTNVDKLLKVHAGTLAARYVARWQRLLSGDLDGLLDTLTSPSSEAIELRQNSPFAGVLNEEERRSCLAAFWSHWQREHAA
jgi:excisionase family DNA binding protein